MSIARRSTSSGDSTKSTEHTSTSIHSQLPINNDCHHHANESSVSHKQPIHQTSGSYSPQSRRQSSKTHSRIPASYDDRPGQQKLHLTTVLPIRNPASNSTHHYFLPLMSSSGKRPPKLHAKTLNSKKKILSTLSLPLTRHFLVIFQPRDALFFY